MLLQSLLQFILRNGANALNQGYRQSAVGILSITLDKSMQLNTVQQVSSAKLHCTLLRSGIVHREA